MAVIKSLEKIYLLKNVDIPEYYLGWKRGIPWRIMEESVTRVSSF